MIWEIPIFLWKLQALQSQSSKPLHKAIILNMLWCGSRFLEVCLSQMSSTTSGPQHREPVTQKQAPCARLIGTAVQGSVMDTLHEALCEFPCVSWRAAGMAWATPGSRSPAAYHWAGRTSGRWGQAATPDSTLASARHMPTMPQTPPFL